MASARRWLLAPLLLLIAVIAETSAFLIALYAWLKDYRRWEGGFFTFYRTLRQEVRR